MEKQYKKDEHTGWNIGPDISIHRHIDDPESWFLTIRPLQIFGELLCEKTRREPEIARYVYLVINRKLELADRLLNEVDQFT